MATGSGNSSNRGSQSQGTGSQGGTRGNQNSNTSNRGFASMDQEKQREIASMGGKAAHESGHAHEFTSEEAREAGRKGGEAVSQNREHMAEIGAQGGRASHSGQGPNDTGETSRGED